VTVDRDFFVSFTGADRPWAAWLLAELDAAGYSSVSQLRDFTAGSNFVTEMHQAARRARRTLGVLSPQALRAPFVWQEWAQRLAADPTGEQRALVLVRVESCEPEGLLGPVVYVDLVGLDEAAAQERLREELASVVRGQRLQPDAAVFPGSGPAAAVADVQRPRFPTALPPVWNVPYRRNPDFTGREYSLAGLAGRLGQGAETAVIQALQGAGGVGKTALAVEYAYRHRSEFDAVWWVGAEEPATLVGDLADLAVALRLAEPGQADQQLAVLAVRHWLDGHDRWLLVLDNAQAPDTPTGLDAPLAHLVDLVPQVLHGQVLVTSRDASWEEHATLTELEVFTPEEATGFLLARSGSSDPTSAAEIAELLGWLPLALEQAGAYVRETRIPLATYLDRLRQYPAVTVTKGRPRDRDPADTVATTWQVSLERVRPIPGAVALLEVCAFLGSEEIPRDLFTHALELVPEEVAVLAGDPFVLDEAVAGLRRFGLVKADEQVLSVHRLVQQVVRDHLDAEQERHAWARRAVDLLRGAFPADPDEPSAWPRCDQLLAHVLAATDNARAEGVAGQTSGSLLTDAGVYLRARAGLPLAQTVLEQALAIREAALGADHPDVALTLTYLGTVLRRRGEPASARQVLERALEINKMAYGLQDPRLAVTLGHLGHAFRELGDLNQARAAHERALAIRQGVYHGQQHPEVAFALRDLGRTLRDAADIAEARSHVERALGIFEAAYGPEHPETATSLDHLAAVLHD
jgi:tetratricopeptide (TPR) repeat protein